VGYRYEFADWFVISLIHAFLATIMGNTFIKIDTFNDHHKEVTINGVSNAAEIVRNFMAEDVEPVQDEKAPDIPLFKYIHPSIISESEKRQIHGEIQNIVRSLPLREVCRYLRQMYKDKRVYLNVKIDAMFDELHRLGLPDENTPGYSFNNFKNYFNID
jgi:hypothetical protein